MVFFNSSVSQEDLTRFFFFSFGESADFLVSHTYTQLTGSPRKWDSCSCHTRALHRLAVWPAGACSHMHAGGAQIRLRAESGSGPQVSHAVEAICSLFRGIRSGRKARLCLQLLQCARSPLLAWRHAAVPRAGGEGTPCPRLWFDTLLLEKWWNCIKVLSVAVGRHTGDKGSSWYEWWNSAAAFI